MTHRLRIALLALVVPVVAAVSAVVTLSATSGSAGPTETGGKPTISIKDFEFGPEALEVASGATIAVVNQDDAIHTVTSEEDGAFDTGDIDGRDTKTIEVGGPGSHQYFCSIHDYMQGVIEVSE